jgi:hypothetical protein
MRDGRHGGTPRPRAACIYKGLNRRGQGARIEDAGHGTYRHRQDPQDRARVRLPSAGHPAIERHRINREAMRTHASARSDGGSSGVKSRGSCAADRPVCPPLRTSCCAAANRRSGPLWDMCGAAQNSGLWKRIDDFPGHDRRQMGARWPGSTTRASSRW